MSKLRSINTSIWSDPWIEDLEPYEKLLFIYLITNEKTNMLGIYEASIKKISFETGIDKVKVDKALKGFESIGKVKYTDNYIILINFLKHQNFNTNMKKSAIDTYNNLPKHLRNSNLDINKDNPSEGFESLLNHFGMVRKIEVEYEVEEEEETEDKNKFTSPSLIEVQKFFIDNKYSKEAANKAYNYYNDLGWVNSKGKEVKNWKSTMRNNWFTKENQAINHPQRFKLTM